jgi:hypothetical protein
VEVEMKMKNGRVIRMELGPPTFRFAIEDGRLGLFWVRNTQFDNILHMRIVTLSWKWPFVRSVVAFTDPDDDED